MERPWIEPGKVKEYTSSEKVKERTDGQLRSDIARAERYVMYHTNNKFDSKEYDENLPEDVVMAVVLLSEAYAIKSINQERGFMSSETYDEYSYTVDTKTDLIDRLGLGPLLDEYVLQPGNGKVNMKLRKI